MILNLLPMLVEQSPLFWILVGSFFFVVGLVWANACWASFRVRLMAAENEQLFLIAEREQAFEAREQRKRELESPKLEQGPKIIRFDEGADVLSSTSKDAERTS